MPEHAGFIELLGIEAVSQGEGHVELSMPVTPDKLQPFGFLHGGATISLLESAASLGAAAVTDLETEVPFGVDVQIRHRKSAQAGIIRGIAELDRQEGSKQYWAVAAYDEAGDVVSEGTVTIKVVSKERLAEIERARRDARLGS